MSTFAQFQQKRPNTKPPKMQSAPASPLPRTFETPESASLATQPSSIDWRAAVEHAARFGHSIGRLAIHPPVDASGGAIVENASHQMRQDMDAGNANVPLPQNMVTNRGRLKPTLQARGIAITYDERLEREADAMGTKASQPVGNSTPIPEQKPEMGAISSGTIQRMEMKEYKTEVAQTAQSKAEGEENIPKWANNFYQWMQKEFLIMQNIGAFSGQVLGKNASGEDVYEKMYENLNDYIQDPAFDKKILAGHLADFINTTGYQNNADHAIAHADAIDTRIVNPGEAYVKAMEGLKLVRWGGALMPASTYEKQPQLADKDKREKPFYSWLYEKSEPSPKMMNCWEAILYSAWQAGLVTKERVKDLYRGQRMGDIELMHFMKKNSGMSQKIGELAGTSIPAGYVIMLGEDGQHFALSTGQLRQTSTSEGERLAGGKEKQVPEILELDAKTDGINRTTLHDAAGRNLSYQSIVRWKPLS